MNQTLYIIHGWAYSIEPWSKTVALLRDAGMSSVIQLRVPGLTSPSDKVYDIDDYVAWLDDQLHNIEKPTVLAHSNGGRIAMHYLEKYPDKFGRLILLDSAGIELGGRKLSKKRQLVKIAAKLLKPLKYLPGVRKAVYRLLGSDYGAAPKNMQKTLANMLASDHNFDPSFITTPTDILWGEDDQITPPAMARKLHQQIANSSLKLIPKWQHAPYRTHPEQLAHEILKILEVKR
jgi:Predicted hydrolases or acyltransferases (alpha/beta hydrolase superfamily)